jgi:hypothetical protein
MLAALLVSTGCVSPTPPSGRRMTLSYSPREAAPPASAERPDIEPPRTLASPPEPEAPERAAVPDSESGAARQSALAAHLAFLGAVGDVSGTTRRISGELSRLKANQWGIAGRAAGVFLPYVAHGERHLRWIDAELAAATRLAHAASQVDDPHMQLALLRLAGPRLEASMLGSLLLAAWLDFLHLVDVVLEQGFNSLETLFANMHRWRKMMEPAMTALSSLEPGQVEAAAKDLPALMGHLSGEFNSTAETIRVAMKRGEQTMLWAQLVEMVTSMSALKMSLPRLPLAAPATLGVGLVAGSNGVMMGTQVVVSAEWVEMMRRLVRAGVLSLPAVSAAVRIHAGQVMMAQAHDALPRGVREALGEGPEVRGMRVTGKAGAGMAEPPRHHVLPREFREWFEKRGFTGEMSIDQFCVKLEQANHEAIHGGGHWGLGRTWPGEWNQMIMDALYQAEARVGRMLTRNEVLDIVAYRMRRYGIPMEFTPWKGP